MHMRSTKQKKHTYLRKTSIQMPYVHLRTYGHLKLKDSLQIHTVHIFDSFVTQRYVHTFIHKRIHIHII